MPAIIWTLTTTNEMATMLGRLHGPAAWVEAAWMWRRARDKSTKAFWCEVLMHFDRDAGDAGDLTPAQAVDAWLEGWRAGGASPAEELADRLFEARAEGLTAELAFLNAAKVVVETQTFHANT